MMASTTTSRQPDQKWMSAKAFIDKSKTYDVKSINTALKGWSPQDRKAFLPWFLKQAELERDAQRKKESQMPALTVTQYINALKNVDFKDTASIAKFEALYDKMDYGPEAQTIQLGTDGNINYVLQPRFSFNHVQHLLGANAVYHEQLVELKSSKQGQKSLPLQYALYLGELDWLGSHGASTTATKPDLIKIPLKLYISALDRSIWLVLDREPQNVLGDRIPITEKTDAWQFLPSSKGKRPPFDVVEIISGDEVMTSDGGSGGFGVGSKRQIFSDKAMSKAQMLALAPYTAQEDVVNKAIASAAAAGAKSSTSQDLPPARARQGG